jgi:hypothetical protein
MKTNHPSYKLIILITQLLLLGGCGWLESPASKPPTSPTIDIPSLKDGEKKCLSILKEGLEKYRDYVKRDIGELGTPPVTWQIIAPKAKNWVLPIPSQINDCKGSLDKHSIKAVALPINTLIETISIINDPKLETKTREEKLKEKIGLIELLSAENPSNNPSELVPRQFIKYTDDKLQELMKLLVGIPSPNSLQNEELQKQITDHIAELANQGEKIKQLESNKNIMMPVVFLLLPLVGVAGYFLGKGSKLPNVSGDFQPKDLSPKQVRQKPIVNDTLNKKGLGGLGGRKTSSAHESPPLAKQEVVDRTPNFRLNDKKQSSTNDSDLDNIDQTTTNPSQRVNPSRYRNPETAVDRDISPRNLASQTLTYDLATEYYNNRSYDLLKPLSKGYYDATSDSVMRNREFWGNPLELFEDSDGLFWIVQTVEPYFLLLPNPLKRIAKTRLPGFEYFFETNFKSENYRSCVIIAPAYMDYISGKWVMAQKGSLDFVY